MHFIRRHPDQLGSFFVWDRFEDPRRRMTLRPKGSLSPILWLIEREERLIEWINEGFFEKGFSSLKKPVLRYSPRWYL